MIKILFFIPDISGGGAEKVLCNLVNNMDQSKFDITVHTVNHYDSKKYLKEGIKYKSIINSKSSIGKKIFSLWYRLCTQFKLTYPLYIKDDYDIEVAYLECGATKVMAASTNKKAKKVAWVHCNVEKKGLTAETVGKYYQNFDQVVCVSNSSKESFDKEFSNYVDSTVLYNVIDEDEIYEKLSQSLNVKWDDGFIHLLTVGRLCNEKGSDRMIEVCHLLKNEGYKFKFHFLGDGPDKMQLQDLSNKLNLSDCIEFEGFNMNPYPFMNRADLIIIPSRSEALSTVAIESLILGKTVVTTPCSGMTELFGKSEYGMITEDSVKSIYLNIKRLLDSQELLFKYSQSAKRRGLEFKKKETIRKHDEFFEGILK